MQILSLLNEIAATFILISPTIFIFTVTLLGNAGEQAQQEEQAARQNDKESIQAEIEQLNSSLESARKNADSSDLIAKLEELKKNQRLTNKKIRNIKIKYSSIDFLNTVLLPISAFLLVLLFSALAVFDFNQIQKILLVFLQFILLTYGMYKLTLALLLVEEISEKKKESETYSKLKESIKLALIEHEQNKTNEVTVSFPDMAFPLNTIISTDLAIKFRVKLTKGSVLENVEVWFFVADGFELIDPSYSWRQGADYSLPNVRTVKINIGKLSVGPVTPRILKLKTPSAPGKYILRYKVYGDGYTSDEKDLTILVG